MASIRRIPITFQYDPSFAQAFCEYLGYPEDSCFIMLVRKHCVALGLPIPARATIFLRKSNWLVDVLLKCDPAATSRVEALLFRDLLFREKCISSIFGLLSILPGEWSTFFSPSAHGPPVNVLGNGSSNGSPISGTASITSLQGSDTPQKPLQPWTPSHLQPAHNESQSSATTCILAPRHTLSPPPVPTSPPRRLTEEEMKSAIAKAKAKARGHGTNEVVAVGPELPKHLQFLRSEKGNDSHEPGTAAESRGPLLHKPTVVASPGNGTRPGSKTVPAVQRKDGGGEMIQSSMGTHPPRAVTPLPLNTSSGPLSPSTHSKSPRTTCSPKSSSLPSEGARSADTTSERGRHPISPTGGPISGMSMPVRASPIQRGTSSPATKQNRQPPTHVLCSTRSPPTRPITQATSTCDLSRSTTGAVPSGSGSPLSTNASSVALVSTANSLTSTATACPSNPYALQKETMSSIEEVETKSKCAPSCAKSPTAITSKLHNNNTPVLEPSQSPELRKGADSDDASLATSVNAISVPPQFNANSREVTTSPTSAAVSLPSIPEKGREGSREQNVSSMRNTQIGGVGPEVPERSTNIGGDMALSTATPPRVSDFRQEVRSVPSISAQPEHMHNPDADVAQNCDITMEDGPPGPASTEPHTRNLQNAIRPTQSAYLADVNAFSNDTNMPQPSSSQSLVHNGNFPMTLPTTQNLHVDPCSRAKLPFSPHDFKAQNFPYEHQRHKTLPSPMSTSGVSSPLFKISPTHGDSRGLDAMDLMEENPETRSKNRPTVLPTTSSLQCNTVGQLLTAPSPPGTMNMDAKQPSTVESESLGQGTKRPHSDDDSLALPGPSTPLRPLKKCKTDQGSPKISEIEESPSHDVVGMQDNIRRLENTLAQAETRAIEVYREKERYAAAAHKELEHRMAFASLAVKGLGLLEAEISQQGNVDLAKRAGQVIAVLRHMNVRPDKAIASERMHWGQQMQALKRSLRVIYERCKAAEEKSAQYYAKQIDLETQLTRERMKVVEIMEAAYKRAVAEENLKKHLLDVDVQQTGSGWLTKEQLASRTSEEKAPQDTLDATRTARRQIQPKCQVQDKIQQADASLYLENHELSRFEIDKERDTSAALRRELDIERSKRASAEQEVQEVRRECKEPFVLPILLDMFLDLQRESHRVVDDTGGVKENSLV